MLWLFTCLLCIFSLAQPPSLTQIKKALETSPNPVGYAREVLKKKYTLDTIIVRNTTQFIGMADSLAYHGKIKKVYGPYQNKYLVQILAKAPNRFNHIRQIFIDTTLFSFRKANSLANSIIQRIKNNESDFGTMAQTYSMGGEGKSSGDLGWIASGAIIPEIEKAIFYAKKGDIIKVWSNNGLHILQKVDEPKDDIGFVLILRVFL